MPYSKASELAAEVVLRLRMVLNRPGTYVRLVAAPNPKEGNYRAEEGVCVCFGTPAPDATSGAGRYGMKAARIVTVTVFSRCTRDPAGSDEIAVGAHLDLEEAVVNALVDRHPDNPLSRVGITLNWSPGGSEQNRMVRRDTSMLQSSLSFTVTYPARLSA